MGKRQLVLFRHGIAEDRDIFSQTGSPDSDRPLTERGVQRTREAATGLMSLVPELSGVGTSPYSRALQTADLIASVYADKGAAAVREVVDDMQPAGSPSGISDWLERQPRSGAVVLVGHEPDLSELMDWFTTGRSEGYARFKKAGACLIEFPFEFVRGGGELVWLLPPFVLRRLGGQAGHE